MSQAKNWIFVSFASVLALTACSALPPTIPTGDGAPIAGSVFDVGYERIAEVYFERPDMGRLAVDGLAGLKDIDPTLGARRNNSTVQLTSGDRVVRNFPAPAADDPHGWAKLTMAALEQGRQVSPILRDATTEDVYEAVFSAITADLDPYSRYITAKRARDERAARDGYGGIGLLLGQDEEQRPIVEDVFDAGPASRAGIQAGSVILAVDDEPVATIGLEALGDRLRGPVASTVRLTVAPPSGGEAAFELRRERIIPDVVDLRYENGIAVIKVSGFNTGTAQDVAKAILDAVERLGAGAKGMILDLRGNPGGLLVQSVDVADLFIRSGQITSTRGRHPDSFQYFDADSTDLSGGLPLVVLIDGRSASGAEVVAAALQDSGRAVIVGATSYGKGSVQKVISLPNGGELFLTWSRFFSPAGFTLHEQGVMPTICTSTGIGDAVEVLARFRSGELAIPASMVDARRAAPDDAEALDRLRSACPWQEHDEALDIEVAELLLENGPLYGQALAVVAQPVLASADRLDTAD